MPYTDKYTGKGGYVAGRWYDAIWTEKPKDDEFTFASSKTWDSDYYNPYNRDGSLKPGWNYHNTDISRGPYAYFLEKVTDEEGNDFWVADARAGADYKSGTRPQHPMVTAIDTGLSIISPQWAMVSGAAKAIKGAATDNWGLAIGGAVQGVAGAYGSFGSSGGSTWGSGDTDPNTGQEVLQGTQGTGGGWGGGDTDPVTGQEILDTTDSAGNIDWEKAGMKLGKKYAKDYGLKALAKSMGGSGGGEGSPQGFLIKDSPFSSILDESTDALDKIFELTGETGDIGTATEAVRAYETQTVQITELEKEIVKYSADPDFKVIEPELRVAAMDALKAGATPKQATAVAFEKAKKERAFREFIKDFQMRKKLEGAGLSGDSGEDNFDYGAAMMGGMDNMETPR